MLFRSKDARSACRPARARPLLEALEDRLVPAQNTWIGPTTDNLWSNPTNWSRGQVPAADDIVTFTGHPGGANASSVDDLPNVTVQAIEFDSSYSSSLTLVPFASLTVSSEFLHYGTLVLEGYNTIAAPQQGINEYGNVLVLGTSNTFEVGSYILNQQASLTVPGEGFISPTLAITGIVLQQGTMSVGDPSTGAAGIVNISGGSYSLPGVTTLFGSTLNYSGATQLILSGTLNLAGNNMIPGSTITAPGITLSGTLTTAGYDVINSSVNNAGTLSFVGTQTTMLTVTGDYSQLNEGSLNMRIGSMLGGSDSLVVDGTATLGGTLRVSLLDSTQTPGSGSSWYLINAWGGATGSFDALSMPPPPAGSDGWAVTIPPPGSYVTLSD
jgi:hypothetical protein